jgi:CheY-like chemotaxis protein
MLAGRLPFVADDLVVLITQHITEPPPPLEGVDAKIAELTLALLEKDAARRIQSADELVSRVDRLLADPSVVPLGSIPPAAAYTTAPPPRDPGLAPSTFVIRLPVVAEVTDQEPQKQAGEDAQSPPTSKRRILVVDDNKVSAKSLGMLLRMVGHEVNIANDGLEAVEAAAMFHPEVVVLDIGMPKLNGYEAARRIRAQQGGESIVLIALTGWGQEEDHRRSQAAGFNHHLTKPVELDALQTLLLRT